MGQAGMDITDQCDMATGEWQGRFFLANYKTNNSIRESARSTGGQVVQI